jgi:hypothetical protein
MSILHRGLLLLLLLLLLHRGVRVKIRVTRVRRVIKARMGHWSSSSSHLMSHRMVPTDTLMRITRCLSSHTSTLVSIKLLLHLLISTTCPLGGILLHLTSGRPPIHYLIRLIMRWCLRHPIMLLTIMHRLLMRRVISLLSMGEILSFPSVILLWLLLTRTQLLLLR